MNTATNATPFPRADHRAKSHPKPKPKVHYRRAVRRQCEMAVARELGVVW